MARSRKPAFARADKVLPGVWRLRLPLPWDATPHGNAWAIEHDGGIVLFDCGFGGSDGLRQLELALTQAGFTLADVKLIACTHTHSDHYGAAASIVERTGCPVWLHPRWDHMRGYVEDLDATVDRRVETMVRNGVPSELAREAGQLRRSGETGFDGLVPPGRELVTGVEVPTDLGNWRTYETPGHAPSHVVFHQPERQLLISGDVVVGKVFLYFDHGHTPDPMGECIESLDVVGSLDAGLCLSGHGRPFRDVASRLDANRAELEKLAEATREAIEGEAVTAYQAVVARIGAEPPPVGVGYLMELTMSALTHLETLGDAECAEGDPIRWSAK